jgi:hypothetical protein
VNKEKHVNFLDFIVQNWLRYGALLVVVIFILVQLSAYNLFNCYFILALLIGLDTIGIQHLKNPKKFIKESLKSSIINFIKAVENRKPIQYYLSILPKDPSVRTENRILFWCVVFLGAVTFVSRYYFIIHDNYSLSDAWINDLNKVIQYDNQSWATLELSTDGELSLVNFYSKITDVSPAIGLQVIAILESVILAIVLFWTIHKLTASKYVAPLITALFFGLVYVLTPLNVYFLLKGNPTFLALSLALPLFVMYSRPYVFKGNKKSYALAYILGFTAIGLIDLFTYCILIPPFLIIAGVLTKKGNVSRVLIALTGFLVASVVIGVIYQIACQYQGLGLIEYIQSNLISISSYTYVPQLILPYKTILHYVQVSTFIGFGVIFILLLFKKTSWRIPLTYFSYFNFLVLLTSFRIKWLDHDLLNNAMAVFLPLVIGFHCALFMVIVNWALKKSENWSPITLPIVFVIAVFGAYRFQEDQIKQLTISDDTPKYMLNAYDHIASTYYNQTYCVVNDPATQVISLNSHYFMNYEYFLKDYPKIDSIQFEHRKDPHFFLMNPEYAVSKSIFVFVLVESSSVEKNVFAENKHYQSQLVQALKTYRKKGRQIQLIYKSPILHVYEIVNQAKQSKINDLLF